VQFLVLPAWNAWQRWQGVRAEARRPTPFALGVYDVTRFVAGRDPVPNASSDTLGWRDVAFDSPGGGSVDAARHTMAVWKTSTIPGDSTFLFTLRYTAPDARTVRLDGVLRGDSVHVTLERSARHFQLAERQFHGLSEYNR